MNKNKLSLSFVKVLEPHEFSDARKSALREIEESQQVNLRRWK